MNLEELNERQREAVLYNDGPLLIIAGAGAGKTKTLTTKIAYLIEKKNVDPENILAITFTNKAAKEMKDRLFKTIGQTAKYLQVSTFHSFGLKLLRENYDALGYDKNFVIMDSDDSLTVVKKIIKDIGYDPKIYNPRAIRNKISSCKNEMTTPEAYERYAASDFEKVVQEVYAKYEKKLQRNNSVDFDDLLLLPIELFKKAGFKYYNEIIILNECLAAALRAGRPMKTRKVTKVHQNAFVFYKGDNFEDIKDEFPVL